MRPLRNVIHAFAPALIVCLAAIAASGQQTKHPGIDLYSQGKIDQAISSLESASRQKEFSSNGDIWNTLGLAYYAKNDLKRSRKAFETAVKAAPAIAAYHGNLSYLYLLTQKLEDARKEAERAIQINPKDANAHNVLGRIELAEEKFDEAEAQAGKIIETNPTRPDGYMLRADVLLARLGKMVGAGWDVRDEIDLLKQASEALKTGAERSKSSPNHKDIAAEAESVGEFYRYFARDPSSRPPAPAANVTPVTILNKPRASYTDRARAAGVSGTIRIAVLLGADGRVQRTLVLKKLGSGLDEAATRAAQAIKFVPEMVDGKPVSVVKIVIYSFSVY